MCTPKQWKVFDENYGQKESECKRRVKEVFESSKVDLRKWYGMYEEKIYGELVAMIEEIPEVEGKSTLMSLQALYAQNSWILPAN